MARSSSPLKYLTLVLAIVPSFHCLKSGSTNEPGHSPVDRGSLPLPLRPRCETMMI